MKIIGVTGGSGGGKTTLLNRFALTGAMVVDCDEVYHHLLQSSQPMLRELELTFPHAFEDGQLNRKALGRIVFNDESKLKMLNAIAWKYVDEEVNLRTDSAVSNMIVLDAIALIESGLADRCDATVAVAAPVKVRVARLQKREGITTDYALARINAQKPNEWFSSNCDYTLENNGTEDEFAEKCDALIAELYSTLT
ncbi:MAG: dephospho-CoA kinase [Oscillospiraceae bacterium]|jgi:dephospho-CoA kinase|nr:dephospho-CoA kinase [Oscillospiraceae bacterium]